MEEGRERWKLQLTESSFTSVYISLYQNRKYTGLEHRQTVRTWTSIVICKLKLQFDNWRLEILKKIGILEKKNWKFGKEFGTFKKVWK